MTLQILIRLATARSRRKRPLCRRERALATARRRHFYRRNKWRGQCSRRQERAVAILLATAACDRKCRRSISYGNWLLKKLWRFHLLATEIAVAIIFKIRISSPIFSRQNPLRRDFAVANCRFVCDSYFPSQHSFFPKTPGLNLKFTNNLKIQISFNPQ